LICRVAKTAPQQLGRPFSTWSLTKLVEHLVEQRRVVISTETVRVVLRDPSWEPKARSLDRIRALQAVTDHLAGRGGTVARLARELVSQAIEQTTRINELTVEITELTAAMAPALIAVPGCGALTAAKILGETAGVDRFKSKDAYARHNGTAPMPVWSSNKARHRLSRTGNRQLNAALHRIALTQAHWHPPAKAMMERRKAGGDSGQEALRVLKRRLSDVVYAALSGRSYGSGIARTRGPSKVDWWRRPPYRWSHVPVLRSRVMDSRQPPEAGERRTSPLVDPSRNLVSK
jgi:hypothetical protein